MTKQLLYVYGLVRDTFDPTGAPAGLEDTAVSVMKRGGIAALVSRVPESDYGAAVVEARSGDVSWLSPRAMAHDRVLTWAHDQGGVIPLPMFSLWGSDDALARSLSERSTDLDRVFERVWGADEFGIRVHRRDAAMLESIDDLDEHIARLRRQAQSASPGQRYLLERKLAEEGKGAVKAASQRMAKDVFETLRSIARDAVSRPLVPRGDVGGVGRGAPEATLVLNGAFLVDHARAEEFRGAVGSLVRRYQPRGLAFDFTGPWPPYNFVGTDKDGGALRGAAGKP